MYAVVIPVRFNDTDAAREELTELVPRVAAMPGFVAGYWVAFSREEGSTTLIFETEESAEALAAVARGAPGAAFTLLSVDVGPVMAHA
jgi:quinol monooxygenase YgiN